MSREELLEHRIYFPESLNLEDLNLHLWMGYSIVLYYYGPQLICYDETRNDLNIKSCSPLYSDPDDFRYHGYLSINVLDNIFMPVSKQYVRGFHS